MPFGEIIPRLTGRSCGAFPCIGRTLPSRHSPRNEFIRGLPLAWNRIRVPLATPSVLSSNRSSCPSCCSIGWAVAPWQSALVVTPWACLPPRIHSPANTSHHDVSPVTRPAVSPRARRPPVIRLPRPGAQSDTTCHPAGACNRFLLAVFPRGSTMQPNCGSCGGDDARQPCCRVPPSFRAPPTPNSPPPNTDSPPGPSAPQHLPPPPPADPG